MDVPSPIRDPCRTRICAEESLESLGPSRDKGPRALLDRHGDAVGVLEPVGAAPPYPAPAAPAAPAPCERDFGHRDGQHELVKES
jgi:hypothetical protein